MNLYDAIKEWIQYQPFEYLVRLDDVMMDIVVRRRYIDHKDDLILQHRLGPSEKLSYSGIVVGRISTTNGWVRVRGRYFNAADPLFFDKLGSELADTCVDPETGWANDIN